MNATRYPNWNRYSASLQAHILDGERLAYTEDEADERPVAPLVPTVPQTGRPATAKQLAFLKVLVAEREVGQQEEALLQTGRNLWAKGELTATLASRLIEMMQAQLRKAKSTDAPATPLQAGIYRRPDGALYRVYLGQNSGAMLAKLVELRAGGSVSYEYAGAAAGRVNASQRLPLAEVGSLGIATGTCLCCGRRLDDPESVDRGIGPVCAGKYDA